MKKELEQKLFDAFPNLYADKDADLKTSLIPMGIETGDGWFQLIWDLSEKLEKIIIQWKEKNPGEENFPRAAQVKEKFASLRFYFTDYLEEFDSLVIEAERKSEITCEVCGGVGEIMTNGHWLKTLCSEHAVYKRHWGGESIYKPLPKKKQK